MIQETGTDRFGPDSPESLAAAALGHHLDVVLRSRRLTLADGTSVEIEGMDDDAGVIVQFVLNGGAMKSTLRNKVAADLFKLVWIRRSLAPDARAILCVSPTVAPILIRRGWLAAAARDLGVIVYLADSPGHVVELPRD